MKIFSGTANLDFAEKVATQLDTKLSDVEIGRFADGEIKIVINENVRRFDCFIIQPTGPSLNASPNDNFMELLIMIDALKRGSASSVTVVMPYYGYERQDRKDYSRAPISARIIASCLESMGVNRVITFDLHAGQIQGFFSCQTPFDNLYVESYFIKYIRNEILPMTNDIDDITIVSPDEGGVKRAVRVAGKLGLSTTIIYKERKNPNHISQMKVLGNVMGKICVIVDDIIDTGGTACKAAEVLKDAGAHSVYMLACHGIFSNGGIERITNSQFDKVIVTNTLSQDRHQDKIQLYNCDKIDYLDVSYLCAEAMRRSHNGESLKELYDKSTVDTIKR
jgi:ribose-phosphate pyrophosphokinase